MTDEQKKRHREYIREWSKQNREKIREYRKNRMRREALAEILAERAESGQNQTKEGGTV